MTHQSPSQSQPLSDDERALAAGYVLGDLNETEHQQMVALLKRRPEVRREVNALQVSLRSLPQGLPPIAPPPSLEAKILTAYETTYASQPQPQPQTAQRPNPITPQPHQSPTSDDALRRSPNPSYEKPKAKSQKSKAQFSWSKIIAGIATLAALWLGTSNARLRYQIARMNSTDAERVAEILQQPTSRLISLQGREETQTATAGGTLLFQKGQWQEVIVSLNNLPPLPVDQVYRMWLTLENGSVLFCGEFNTRSDGTVLVRLAPPELPPQGVKATGLFVTQNASGDPLTADGTPLMVGEI